MISINKKGVLGKIFTSPFVMLLVVFIMGIGLFLAASIFLIKGANIPSVIESVNIEESFFDRIKVRGEAMSIVHGLIKDSVYRGEEKNLKNKLNAGIITREERVRLEEANLFYGELRKVIKEMFEKKTSETNEQCLIIFLTDGRPVENNVDLARDIFFKFNKETERINSYDVNFYYDAGLLRKQEVFIAKYKLPFVMQYYYGECYSLSELDNIIQERKNE